VQTIISILTICFHQYIGGTGLAAPIGKETLTFRKFKNFADFLNVSSTNILVPTGQQHQYIGAIQRESKG
jgi:hypothetical protein